MAGPGVWIGGPSWSLKRRKTAEQNWVTFLRILCWCSVSLSIWFWNKLIKRWWLVLSKLCSCLSSLYGGHSCISVCSAGSYSEYLVRPSLECKQCWREWSRVSRPIEESGLIKVSLRQRSRLEVRPWLQVALKTWPFFCSFSTAVPPLRRSLMTVWRKKWAAVPGCGAERFPDGWVGLDPVIQLVSEGFCLDQSAGRDGAPDAPSSVRGTGVIMLTVQAPFP